MKTVLVTGATRGLGIAIVHRLASDGFRIVAMGRCKTNALEKLANQFEIHFHDFDMKDFTRIQDFVRMVIGKYGPIFALVNNAAIGMDGVLGTMHNSDIERVMRVNTLAPMILTKYVSRSVLSAREGRIVNISSIIASTGFSGLAVYAASKSAIEGFTKSLARELGRMNITVNAVAPGYMQTDMTEGLQGEKLKSIVRRSPLGRLATVDDAAGAVSYFVGSDGGAVTGSILTVDAGSTC